MTRPPFYRAPKVAPVVAFVDPATGAGVVEGGRPVFCRPGARRRRPSLPDLADGLAAAGVTRAYLTGPAFPDLWYTLDDRHASGWGPDKAGHYRDTDDPRIVLSRPAQAPGGPARVDLRRVGAWGLPETVAPAAAAYAWEGLRRLLAARWRDADARGLPLLLATPTATGQQLAALSAPKDWEGAQLDDELAALVRATAPQHRIEVPGRCYAGCDAHSPRPYDGPEPVTYLDARFAYASLVRELGTGPAHRLTGDAVAELIAADPYIRARALVTYRVPDGWEHPGLLMEPHPDGRHWHAPDRPGYVGSTWADAYELVTARAYGWPVRFVEGLLFTPGRVLDVWADRLVDAWTDAQAVAVGTAGNGSTEHRQAGQLVAGMLRVILLRTIGAFHSTGRLVQHTADEPLDVPAAGVITRTDLPDGRVTYTTRKAPRGAAAAWARPELSAQVWARAHVRLHTHGSAGFLSLPPDAVWGMWGDALYVAGADAGELVKAWPDDGRPGRYRVKGSTPAARRPANVGGLLRLRDTIGG